MITNLRFISFICGCGYVQNIEHVQFFGHKSIKEINPIPAHITGKIIYQTGLILEQILEHQFFNLDKILT